MILTLNNIAIVDSNKFISVWSTLLMPEANHVTQFVNHDVFIVTTVTNRDLSFLSFVPNVRCPATAMWINNLTMWTLVKLFAKFQSDLPSSSDKLKINIMMWLFLDKFDTSSVFPLLHGIFCCFQSALDTYWKTKQAYCFTYWTYYYCFSKTICIRKTQRKLTQEGENTYKHCSQKHKE